MKKRILSMLLCLVMALSLCSTAAFAADGDVDKSKTVSSEALDPTDPVTTVTLSLPSGERQYEYDVVFVMDSSSSTTNNDVDFSVQVTSLMDALVEKNAKINVGVVKC